MNTETLPENAADCPVGATPRQRRGEETRQRLVEAAFWDIYRNGYQGSSLAHILDAAGCTKGSLYHHFPDKHALGLAVVRERMGGHFETTWIAPLSGTDDPLPLIKQIVGRYAAGEHREGIELRFGCPLNNLCQEMSPIDEEFRLALESVLARWRAALEAALRRGQQHGTVRTDRDPAAVAAMVVALHQGVIGTMKSALDPELGGLCAKAFFDYLDHLRP